ncbi:MAG TPA: hypothetical protein VLT33_13960 [Labilithrix sp.]|nr:hypothetical protein [Labilithrix sp.]
MNARFVLTGLLTSALNLLLHAGLFVGFLKDFFEAHPAGSPEFLRQLNRGLDELVPWALVASALALGFFITVVVRWSGAKGAVSGLKSGAVMGLLYWAGINFGLYASSHNFSLPSTLADLVCSALCMTLSAGFAAWMLNRSSTHRTVDEMDDVRAPALGQR